MIFTVEEWNAKQEKYYQENKERIDASNELLAKRMEQHKKNDKTYNTQYMRNRRRKDTSFRMLNILRTRVVALLKSKNKSASTMFLIGCSIDYLMHHLQKQFTEGMNWDNHGRGDNGKGMKEWHIDHIKSCSKFDLRKPEEQRKCFHYSNLQPLWAKINLKKALALDK